MHLGYAAENLVVIRHIALNLLKADTTLKFGVKSKRLVTGWDNVYLLRLVASNLKL